MTYPSPLLPGVLLRRYKRFLADVQLDDGPSIVAHCPNPGRMTSCLAERAPCRVTHRPSPKRKLAYTLEQVCVDGTWIVVNTAVANQVAGEALRAGEIPELAGYAQVDAEVRTGEARLDFALRDPERAPCWIEVKTVTLLDGGVLRFPDAVSKRAARHAHTLRAAVERGDRAVLLFLVGRGDGTHIEPADAIDPAYGVALREAARAGVQVLARRMVVGARDVRLGESVAVVL